MNVISKKMKKPIIGITMGDPAGIGAEITVKALEDKKVNEKCRPVVIGDSKIIKDAIRFIPSDLRVNTIREPEQSRGLYGTLDMIDLDNIELEEFEYGAVSAQAGQAAVDYILKGIALAEKGQIDAVVTGPIHKKSVQKAGYSYPGHTEIFAEKTGTDSYAMLLVHGKMRVIHVSTHIPLREACSRLKKERVLEVILLADKVMKMLGEEEPRIGVAGLNPHGGERGLFGREEIEEIKPAVFEAEKKGLLVEGPIPADTLFPKLKGGLYDIGVAMYHDQGHIPVKLAGFDFEEESDRGMKVSGVNMTVGLPFIRTSVDHGVAFDMAGRGEASENSLKQAIFMASELAENRGVC